MEEVLAHSLNFLFKEVIVKKLNSHFCVFFFSFDGNFFNSNPQISPFLMKLTFCFVVRSQLVICRIVIELPFQKEFLTRVRSENRNNTGFILI